MSTKVNFRMVNNDAVTRMQTAMNDIFAHATESVALAKAMRNAKAIVKAAVDKYEGGGEAELRAEIEKTPDNFDAKLVQALGDIQRIDYKRTVLSKWYKETIQATTDYFRLDDIIEELGATNLEDGVKAVDALLVDIFGLEKVAKNTRYKFARALYSAMDGQRKSSNKAVTKGTLLTERSRREIKEVGIRAMCDYAGRTANIVVPTKDNYAVTMKYAEDFVRVTGYDITEI